LKKKEMYRFILILIVFCSCRSAHNQNSNQGAVPKSFTGIIHVNENGCPIYIEISNCLVSNQAYYIGKKVYPVNLEDKFKKKGLKVHFNLTVSKAPSPEGCNSDYVVSVEDLSVIAK
jgi:hypothetical protein